MLLIPMKMLDFNHITPFLNFNVELVEVSPGQFVVQQTKLKHQIRINKLTHSLLKTLDGKKTIGEITIELNSSLATNQVHEKMIHDLLYQKLYPFGIIDNNEDAAKRKSANYLNLRFPMIPKSIVEVLSNVFRILFTKPTTFFYVFGILLIVLLSTTVYTSIQQDIFNIILLTKTHSIIIFLFGFLVCLFHEIGHTSALAFSKRKAGEIGVGFYLMYPVFYCDVSETWLLSKRRRLMVNLGGLYFETLVGILFLLLYFITFNPFFIWLNTIILVRFIVNLNPFLRRDGYWMLSDVVNMPNLQKDAMQYVLHMAKAIYKGKIKAYPKNYFLLGYGLLAVSFIFLFLGMVVLSNPSSILYFPINVWNEVLEISQQGFALFSVTELLEQFALPLLFYFLLIKLTIKWVRGKLKNKREIKSQELVTTNL